MKVNLKNQEVYEIPYEDWDKTYIGQTNRKIIVIIGEHKNVVRKKERRLLINDLATSTNHVETSAEQNQQLLKLGAT